MENILSILGKLERIIHSAKKAKGPSISIKVSDLMQIDKDLSQYKEKCYYTKEEVNELLNNDKERIKKFEEWMVGQTITIIPCYYKWDVNRFLEGGEVID